MKYRLLALDLDGTLLDSSGRIPQANIQALMRLQASGVTVALCTGRGLTESMAVIKQLRHTGPVVLAGGALVSDPQTGQTLRRAVIEPVLTEQIIEHLDPRRHAVIALLDPGEEDHDYLVVGAERLTSNTRWWFETIGARLRCADRPAFEDLHHVLRVGIVTDGPAMIPIQDSLERRFGSRIVVQHFVAFKERDEDIEILEVFSQGVSKWAGLEWIMEQHGIGPGQAIAIGDEINDLSMVRAAGCGIAMGNAVHAVRLVAKHTTLSNDEAGVAHAIDRILQQQW